MQGKNKGREERSQVWRESGGVLCGLEARVGPGESGHGPWTGRGPGRCVSYLQGHRVTITYGSNTHRHLLCALTRSSASGLHEQISTLLLGGEHYSTPFI